MWSFKQTIFLNDLIIIKYYRNVTPVQIKESLYLVLLRILSRIDSHFGKSHP